MKNRSPGPHRSIRPGRSHFHAGLRGIQWVLEKHPALLLQQTNAQVDWWCRTASVQIGTRAQMPSAAGILTKANKIEPMARIGTG